MEGSVAGTQEKLDQIRHHAIQILLNYSRFDKGEFSYTILVFIWYSFTYSLEFYANKLLARGVLTVQFGLPSLVRTQRQLREVRTPRTLWPNQTPHCSRTSL